MIRLNDKFLNLDNPTRYYIYTGGRGSGKSFAIGCLVCLLTQESGHVILFTRYTLRAASISIIPEFIEKIYLLGMQELFDITKDEIINKSTGSRILFRGIKTSSGDQTANLKSLQGVTTWVLDEAEELTKEDIFDTIDLSVRQKNKQNRIILIMNPTTKEHWVYKRFFEGLGVRGGYNGMKGDVSYSHSTYLDNIANLSDSYIQQLKSIKESNPKKYEHKILGGWLDKAEGVVFQNWQFGDMPSNITTSFGLDFGFSVDPDALIEVGIDKKHKKIYLKQHIYENGLRMEVLANKVLNSAKEALVIADSAESRLIADLRHKGINIRPVKKGKVEEGVTLMLDYQLIVHPDSTDIAKELNNYTYIDKTSALYIDDYNHAIDAIRYNVTYVLQNPNRGTYNLR